MPAGMDSLSSQVGDMMVRDTELDRLKAVQDRAFQKKQDAYKEQQNAWERRSSARESMNRSFEAKQRAYSVQDDSWQQVARLQASLGPRIESLNADQEQAFRAMQSAFDRASAAHASRDGASAAAHAAEGHGHKATAQECVAQRRRLVAQIRSAREAHEATKPAFQRAKDAFISAKREYDAAKATHERAANVFKEAKVEFDRAKTAFQDRLAKIKADNRLHKEKNRRLAERAGVPSEHLDRMKVRYDPDGGINFYYGGLVNPDGPGHGHIAVDPRGEVKYKRDPFDPHGSQNFTKDPRWQRFDTGFAEAVSYKGFNTIKESGVDSTTGRLTVNFFYGGSGGNPLGKGHGHDVMYADDPTKIVFTRAPRR